MDDQGNAGAVTPRPSPLMTGLIVESHGIKSTATSTPSGIRSSPPIIVKAVAMDSEISPALPEDVGVKSDSEAETIVLPGKDGHSPSQIRKSIKHEDRSEDEGEILSGQESEEDGEVGESAVATSTLGKRKRSRHGQNKDNPARTHLGNSSRSGSVPTSPVNTTRSSLSKPVASDSDISRSPSPSSPHSALRSKAKSVDRVLPRRKQYISRSGDEEESRGFVRQRNSGSDPKQGREKDNREPSIQNSELQKRIRSISPSNRSHRRSISSQLPLKNIHGLSHKKKCVPAPLQSTEYQSDESSASASSSHPRSSRLHALTAPAIGDSTIYPAKMAPHKKHVNSSGQTLLARACAAGKLEAAKSRLEERPGDLNVGDNASNTPLHTASIDGHEDLVKLLLDAGCNVDPINLARDTPLHDAIENGHADVVKLLLDAGANPRKANGKGEDPIDLANDNSDESIAEEMKEAIIAAKKKSSDIRKSSEDEQTHELASRMSHPKESPRQTPPAYEAQFANNTNRRNAGTRAVKTKDSVLYQRFDLDGLEKAAAENDIDSICRILEVHSSSRLDDPRSLTVAAKAGHYEVINLLFALGNFDPDPQPLKDLPADSATPILAAIGRDNVQVIELLLNQSNFDPTRLFRGETYYEIARKRGGHCWKDEEVLLKTAFDKYKADHKLSPKKARSPGLRRDGRDVDLEGRKTSRKEEPQTSRSHKRNTSSPKMNQVNLSKTQHKRTRSSSQSKESQAGLKKGFGGRPKQEDSAASEALPDREPTPLGPPKQKPPAKRSESDVAVASESESTAKPRRKLVSGKEFRGERDLDKERRASIASNASSASVKERREGDSKVDRLARKPSPNVSRSLKSGTHDQEPISGRSQPDKDKQRSIKRDDSKDRLSVIRGENPVKRSRKSETPPRSGMQDINGLESGEIPQKRRKLEGESKASRKAESVSSSSPDQRVTAVKNSYDKSSSEAKDKSHSIDKRIESPEIARHVSDDSFRRSSEKSAKIPTARDDTRDPDVVMEDAEGATLKAQEEREAQNRREIEKQQAKERAERVAIDKKMEEDRIEEAAKQVRLAKEQAEREEEEKRKQEAERKERQRQEDAEAHAREMERQRVVYQEQERLKREEQERRRAQALEQQRAERIRLEREKEEERLSKLPLLLRWFDQCANARLPERAALFRFIEGFRYDTIRPEATGQPNGREEWMLNTHAALLLGEKDLQLSRYTAWEHIPLSHAAKQAIWQFENPIYSLSHPSLQSLRRRLPDSGEPSYEVIEHSKALFLGLDMFFIKVSEFMYVVPSFPHLRGLELVVKYRELQEFPVWPPGPGKWKQDPDTDPSQTFAPRPKYYVNGLFTKQGQIQCSKTSTTSFGDRRAPRRNLVQQAFPGDLDFERLASEQGLHHLITPKEQPSEFPNGQVNGMTTPRSENSKSVNGGSPRLGNGLAMSNGVHAADIAMSDTPE